MMPKKWTDDEIKYLHDKYNDKTVKEVAEDLDRSKSSVKCKASKLKITNDSKWTKEEEKYLKNNYGPDSDKTAKEIAETLDRSQDSVENKIKYENLSYVEQKSFTEEELYFIRQNYNHMSYQELAEKLGRDKGTIASKVSKMDIEKTPFYSESEKTFIQENWKELSDYELAEEIDRSVVSVRKKRRSLGCKRDSFVGTDEHWKWEAVCEKVAKQVFDKVETQKVFDNDLRPDIYVKSKKLVIDAKTSCYRGLNDLKKYKKCDGVDRVTVWSMSPVSDTKNAVKVEDIDDLQEKVDFDVKESISEDKNVSQKKVVAF